MKVEHTMKVEQLFEELKNAGITTGQFPEYVDWDTYVANLQTSSAEGTSPADDSLQKILNNRLCPDKIKNLTLNDLLHKGFYEAKQDIDLMSLDIRIALLADLDEYKCYLYDSIGHWGDPGCALSATDFRSILGKIKHLEIIQNWLFGIE